MALKVTNPANGSRIATLPADDAKSVKAKYERARAAQPAWARVRMKQRLEAIARFRELVVADSRAPRARAHLRGRQADRAGAERAEGRAAAHRLLPRGDGDDAAHRAGLDAMRSMEERISHEPLGVVANISAWNYPWFVGSNVFVPALLAGNAVLYKPSEFAAMTGLEIARLLHEAGIPEGRLHRGDRRRRGRRGAARAARRRRVLHRLGRHRQAHRRRRSPAAW